MAMTVHGIIRMHGREHRQKFNKRRTGAATASSPLSVYKKIFCILQPISRKPYLNSESSFQWKRQGGKLCGR